MLLRVREIRNQTGAISSTYSHQIGYIRIQPFSRSRQNGQGEQAFANWKLFLHPTTDIESDDKFEWEGKVYSILQIYKARDKNDIVHHIEVTI